MRKDYQEFICDYCGRTFIRDTDDIEYDSSELKIFAVTDMYDETKDALSSRRIADEYNEARQTICDVIGDVDDNSDGEVVINFNSPVRIHFEYVTEDGINKPDEANAVYLKYDTAYDDVIIGTDDEYYGEIYINDLWHSSVVAIAENLKIQLNQK
jgi:hypothetical protein